jgi:hypothetical protein
MALHALEPEDEQDFLAHLSGCALCERALVEHEAALSELAYAADPVEPPPSLLEGIRAGVRASGRPVVVADQPVTPTVPTADPAGVPAVVPAAPPASLAEARSRREQRTPRAAHVARCCGCRRSGRLGRRVGQRPARAARRAGPAQQPAGQHPGAAGGPGDADGPPAVRRRGGGRGRPVSDTEVELVLDGLPVNGDDTPTSLWGEAPDGSVQAVGAFDVTSADLQVRAGCDGRGIQRLMVTHEHGRHRPRAHLPCWPSGASDRRPAWQNDLMTAAHPPRARGGRRSSAAPQAGSPGQGHRAGRRAALHPARLRPGGTAGPADDPAHPARALDLVDRVPLGGPAAGPAKQSAHEALAVRKRRPC